MSINDLSKLLRGIASIAEEPETQNIVDYGMSACENYKERNYVKGAIQGARAYGNFVSLNILNKKMSRHNQDIFFINHNVLQTASANAVLAVVTKRFLSF